MHAAAHLSPPPTRPLAAFAALLATLLAVLLATVGADAARAERTSLHIVGSSTVFPFSQAVAEEFASLTGGAAPVVEATGTGGGFKLFCSSLGFDTPDITGASRAITDSERALCLENGVSSVSEVLIGFDGLSLAQSREGLVLSLTLEHVFLALAAEVPQGGVLVSNPHNLWSEVDSTLPAIPILVFGPPPTSGTRDAFVELAMNAGCATVPEIAKLEHARREAVCARMRSDGPFIEAGENDNLIVQRLRSDPSAVGIFGFSFLTENSDALRGLAIDGVEPSFAAIRAGTYPLVRPLFFYIKNEHRGAVPGLEAFVEAYVDDSAIGEKGFLRTRGLVPLDAPARAEVQAAAREGRGIDLR